MKPYYDHKGITIYHGDCRDVLPLLKRRFDAVITDPPYAIPTQIAQTRVATTNLGDLSIVEAGLSVMFRLCDSVLKTTSRYFIFCDGTSYPVLNRVFYGRFRTALLVWDKGRIGMGREFRKSHELILHAWMEKTPIVDSNGNGRSDILKCSPVGSQRFHDAEKPIALIEQLLWVCGTDIIDPFMGSGSTLCAAKQSGRNAIGIEIEEKYCEIAARRLAQEMLPFGSNQALETDGPKDGHRSA